MHFHKTPTRAGKPSTGRRIRHCNVARGVAHNVAGEDGGVYFVAGNISRHPGLTVPVHYRAGNEIRTVNLQDEITTARRHRLRMRRPNHLRYRIILTKSTRDQQAGR